MSRIIAGIRLPSGYRLPFGKYKSCSIDLIPDSYLNWLHAQEWLAGPLATAVHDELDRRLDIQIAEWQRQRDGDE
jgi:uncharacterized protein (DUF3820 family)